MIPEGLEFTPLFRSQVLQVSSKSKDVRKFGEGAERDVRESAEFMHRLALLMPSAIFAAAE